MIICPASSASLLKGSSWKASYVVAYEKLQLICCDTSPGLAEKLQHDQAKLPSLVTEAMNQLVIRQGKPLVQ